MSKCTTIIFAMICNFVHADNESFIIIDQIKYSRYLISSYQFMENFRKK